MIYNQQAKYLQTSIQTATPTQLLIMLYDGAIRSCKLGIEAIKNKKYSEANHHLQKVQDIVSELMITLKRDAPIADQLMRLYDYFQYNLTQANMKKEIGPVEEVLQFLIELKQTWMEAAKEAMAAKRDG